MTELRRLVVEPRAEEVVIRVLYHSAGDSNPGTKARAREVSNLIRTGLEQALEALENAECVGTSGFTTREDVLLATISPDKAKLMKGA